MNTEFRPPLDEADALSLRAANSRMSLRHENKTIAAALDVTEVEGSPSVLGLYFPNVSGAAAERYARRSARSGRRAVRNLMI